ncbi:TPA: hypothetical protein ACH3X1_008774 [Trebouxia sp. C0004]
MYIATLVPWLVSSSMDQTCSTKCRVNLQIESMQQTRSAGAATQVNTSKLCYHQQQSRMPAYMLSVHKPEFECTSCSTRIAVHPISIDCFPATPRQATVWYDQQLLVATAAAQHSDPVAIQAHCAALKQLHIHNGCGLGHPGIWTNLCSASQNWHRVEVEMSKRDQFQLPGMFADQSAWQNCPCCWRTCQALMGDACLGITCLRAAASSSHAVSPVYTDGPFVADAAVKDLLSERQNVDRALLDPPSCADFKAAKPSGKLSWTQLAWQL